MTKLKNRDKFITGFFYVRCFYHQVAAYACFPNKKMYSQSRKKHLSLFKTFNSSHLSSFTPDYFCSTSFIGFFNWVFEIETVDDSKSNQRPNFSGIHLLWVLSWLQNEEFSLKQHDDCYIRIAMRLHQT